MKKTLKTKTPISMIGSLWFVFENEDGTKPKSQKEFYSNADFSDIAHLPKGIFAPQSSTIKEHIKFDFNRKEYKESIVFKLFLSNSWSWEVKGQLFIWWNPFKCRQ